CHKWWPCNLTDGNHFNYRRMAIPQAVVSLACIPDQSDVLVSDQLGVLSFRRGEICADPFPIDPNSPFVRDASNKLVRRGYWMDMTDNAVVIDDGFIKTSHLRTRLHRIFRSSPVH